MNVLLWYRYTPLVSPRITTCPNLNRSRTSSKVDYAFFGYNKNRRDTLYPVTVLGREFIAILKQHSASVKPDSHASVSFGFINVGFRAKFRSLSQLSALIHSPNWVLRWGKTKLPLKMYTRSRILWGSDTINR